MPTSSDQYAIRVSGLGKQYVLGANDRYKTFRDLLMSLGHASRRRLASLFRSGQRAGTSESAAGETIWALRGVSCEISRGEVVGLIGRNGAGKSTLLKILSRVTTPTEGSAELTGRVGSLLEVGTGFHAELTGRENVYLNAAILGMKKREIDRKFDEILAFAEVEKFADTPVKHYSSGMYVRLAFAVAAHLESEILMVDEVLAVGDAEFQEKCFGKMGSVAEHGRTILFVSHNLGSIRRLCTRAIWLDGGMIREMGATQSVIEAYLRSIRGHEASGSLASTSRRSDLPGFRFTGCAVVDEHDRRIEAIEYGEDLRVRLTYESDFTSRSVVVCVAIATVDLQYVQYCDNLTTGDALTITAGTDEIFCVFRNVTLVPGTYRICVMAHDLALYYDWVDAACTFDVLHSPRVRIFKSVDRTNGVVWFDVSYTGRRK